MPESTAGSVAKDVAHESPISLMYYLHSESKENELCYTQCHIASRHAVHRSLESC